MNETFLCAETDQQTRSFLLENRHYSYNIEEAARKIEEIHHNQVIITNSYLPTININVNNCLIVKLVFSEENEVILVVAHGLNEIEKIPLEPSDLPVEKALTVYLGKVYDFFQNMFGENGLFEFAKFLLNYSDFHTSRCHQCGKVFIQDSFGVVAPPILRDPKTGLPYHVKCRQNGFEGLENLGFVNTETPVKEKL